MPFFWFDSLCASFAFDSRFQFGPSVFGEETLLCIGLHLQEAGVGDGKGEQVLVQRQSAGRVGETQGADIPSGLAVAHGVEDSLGTARAKAKLDIVSAGTVVICQSGQGGDLLGVDQENHTDRFFPVTDVIQGLDRTSVV